MLADKFLGTEICYFKKYVTWCVYNIQNVVEGVCDMLWCMCVVFVYFIAHISMMSDVIVFLSREENPEEKGEHLEKRDCRAEKLVHPGNNGFFL